MEIELDVKYGYRLNITAENVKIVEDIEERIYERKQDGTIDYTISPQRDITDPAVKQILGIAEDIIYYREREYDSSKLIEELFEKLPQEICSKLLRKLRDKYEEDLD